MRRLVYNAIQTPDGTVLVSGNRHDYVTHKDAVTGETYMLDGGIDYVRSNINKVPATDLSVCLEDGHRKVREALEWGTYGKDGKQPLRRVKLADMDTDHIEACLATQVLHPHYKEAFQAELAFRDDLGLG